MCLRRGGGGRKGIVLINSESLFLFQEIIFSESFSFKKITFPLGDHFISEWKLWIIPKIRLQENFLLIPYAFIIYLKLHITKNGYFFIAKIILFYFILTYLNELTKRDTFKPIKPTYLQQKYTIELNTLRIVEIIIESLKTLMKMDLTISTLTLHFFVW